MTMKKGNRWLESLIYQAKVEENETKTHIELNENLKKVRTLTYNS